MKHYTFINVTYYNNRHIADTARIHIIDAETTDEICSRRVSIKVARKAIHKLMKQGYCRRMGINQFDPTIQYITIDNLEMSRRRA